MDVMASTLGGHPSEHSKSAPKSTTSRALPDSSSCDHKSVALSLCLHTCVAQERHHWTPVRKGRLEQVQAHKSREQKPVGAYPISQCERNPDTVSILDEWFNTHPEERVMRDKLTISRLSSAIKAEKRAELAQRLSGIVDLHVETELRIARAANGTKERGS